MIAIQGQSLTICGTQAPWTESISQSFPAETTLTADGLFALLPTENDSLSYGKSASVGDKVFSNTAMALLLLAVLFLVIDLASRRLGFGGTVVLVCLVAAIGLASTKEVARRTLR